MDWDKKHEYGKTFLPKHWTELSDMVVEANDRRRKAPGYNSDDDIVDGAVTGNNNQEQEAFNQGLFAGVEEQSAADTVHSIIDSGATSVTSPTMSDDATMVTTLSKFEASLAAADKKIRVLEKKGEQDKKGGGGANPCKHCKCCKQKKSNEGIEEKKLFPQSSGQEMASTMGQEEVGRK